MRIIIRAIRPVGSAIDSSTIQQDDLPRLDVTEPCFLLKLVLIDFPLDLVLILIVQQVPSRLMLLIDDCCRLRQRRESIAMLIGQLVGNECLARPGPASQDNAAGRSLAAPKCGRGCAVRFSQSIYRQRQYFGFEQLPPADLKAAGPATGVFPVAPQVV